MAKAAKVARTWTSKTTTKKSRRYGIYAKAHHNTTVVRLQTPVRATNARYRVLTVMREAFEALPATKQTADHDLFPSIVKALKSNAGTYTAANWRVTNRRQPRVK